MGNCFSDPSHAKPPGKGQKLGSGPSAGASAGAGAGGGQRLGGGPGAAPAAGQRYNDPPRTLGGPVGTNGPAGAGTQVGSGMGSGLSEEEQRDRMLRAAEERARAVRLCSPLSLNRRDDVMVIEMGFCLPVTFTICHLSPVPASLLLNTSRSPRPQTRSDERGSR